LTVIISGTFIFWRGAAGVVSVSPDVEACATAGVEAEDGVWDVDGCDEGVRGVIGRGGFTVGGGGIL
jgi:hypothetical protein